MKKTFKVLFYLKKSRTAKEGRFPIYSRLTVDGKRVEWNTQRMSSAEQWSTKSCRVSGTSKEAKAINAWLEQLNAILYESQRELLASGKEVSAKAIRSLYNGEPVEEEAPRHTILEVYQYHNDQFATLVGKEFANGTLKKYKTAYKSIEEFIKHQYKMNDLPIDQLNYQFITEYEYYLKTIKNIQHNTAMGMIKKLKKIVRQCVANDWLMKDPFMAYKVKTRETHRAYLSETEIEELIKKKFSTTRLELIKDLFLFSCFTGLSYTDLITLKLSDLVIGIDREIWINTTRIKTGTLSRIPLLPQALEIVARYCDDPRAVNAGTLRCWIKR